MISFTSANTAARPAKPSFAQPKKDVKMTPAQLAKFCADEDLEIEKARARVKAQEAKKPSPKKEVAPAKPVTKKASPKPPHDPKETITGKSAAAKPQTKPVPAKVASIPSKSATVFTFISMPPEGRKVPPQMVIVLEELRKLKSATMAQLTAKLGPDRLKTAQTPERIVTFYRRRMEIAGYITAS